VNAVNVNGSVLLWSIATVPVPVSIDKNNATTDVAVVFATVTSAGVVAELNRKAVGSYHSAVVFVPLAPKPVPVKVMVSVAGETSPGHPVDLEILVRCHADAAWALPRNTSRPTTLARRLMRVANRRLRA
jgi:hypothetical protein